MGYIVLECVSALIILLIYILSLVMTKYRDYKTKILEASCIVTLIFIITGTFSYLCIGSALNRFSLILCNISLSISYLSACIIPFIFTIYAYSHLYKEKSIINKKILLISIPIIIEILLLVINPFTNIFFSISLESTQLKGLALYNNSIVAIVYIFINILLAFKNWKSINNTLKVGILIYPFVSIFLLLLYYYFLDMFVLGAGSAVVIVLLTLVMRQRQIQTDDLTNLLSRSVFFEHLATLDNDEISYKIFIISLRNFKIVNNNYGTYIGDKLLTYIGEYLEHILKGFQVYRYSGDEYAIILKNKDLTSSENIINNIISRFDDKWQVDEFKHRLNAYFSILTSKSLTLNKIPIVTFTDYFIKHVKENYEGKLIICNNDIVKKLGRKEDIYASIFKAIMYKSFLVYLQPIFDSQKNSFVSAEALVRLEDEKLGMIYPNEFIPIAEERNLISKIDIIMFEKVCQILSELEKQKVDIGGISVNFSIDIFMENDLVDRLKALINQYEIAPGKIRIEITETVLAKSYLDLKLVINEIKKLGILFYLDDFGIGYSNLVSVIKLPFDFIKLDKALSDELETSKTVMDLVKSLCEIFSIRGFDIVCEGIESEKQLEILKYCEVRYIQGYIYAKPLPANQTIELFSNQKIQPSQ